MVISHLILAGTWTLYCILHSLLAAPGVKLFIKKRSGVYFRFYRLFYIVFATVALALVMLQLFLIHSLQLFGASILTMIAGACLAGAGLVIMFICIFKYFMQLSSLNNLTQHGAGDELMISGIHQFVRHPLYAGTFVFIWGLLVLFPYASVLIVDAIITIYTLLGLRFEERKLSIQFGAQYGIYQQNTPMIIPRLASFLIRKKQTG